MTDDLERQLRAGDALAWGLDRLDALVDAGTPSAVLELLVREARELTGAPSVWALTWSGDLSKGKASFRALAGVGPEGVPAPSEISRTFVGRVIREGRPAWSDDAASDARFQDSESIVSFTLRSLGCVPVGPKGVLYLLDPQEPGRFSLEHRLRIAALCQIAGSFLRGAAPSPSARGTPHEPLPGMVGSDGAMAEVVHSVRAFAPWPWPVLVLGETGSGKELVARALHTLSPRAQARFVVVDCGAITDTLAESTLFGHERGAFTGAERRHAGAAERVGGGTLFLDEVGELEPKVQVKLLRLIRERTFTRVGGSEELRFEGRIVAATNLDVDDPDKRGGFRDDLFHRMGAVIRLPPLRDRRAHIPALAEVLVERELADAGGKPPVSLSAGALSELRSRSWPGNVADLQNTLRVAIAMCVASGSTVILPEHLSHDWAAARLEDCGLDLKAATEQFQKRLVYRALDASGDSRTGASDLLGVSRQWLHRLLRRWEDDHASDPEAET